MTYLHLFAAPNFTCIMNYWQREGAFFSFSIKVDCDPVNNQG